MPAIKITEDLKLEAAILALSPSDRAAYLRGRKIFKTDGDCEYRLVDNPDNINNEGGFRKNRKRVTNFTKPKKKRKNDNHRPKRSRP